MKEEQIQPVKLLSLTEQQLEWNINNEYQKGMDSQYGFPFDHVRCIVYELALILKRSKRNV
jgi:hypothetical protein